MRHVPTALQAHLNGAVTTTCRLLKIRSRSGVVFGLTTLDVDVPYDDGTADGLVDYLATNGFDAATIQGDIGYSVDNTEVTALISVDVPGVTQEMIDAGEFDDAAWVCYLVNYKAEDSNGQIPQSEHVELGSGDLGEVTTRNGIVWVPELLDLIVRLKQPIGEVTSRTCRAIFGTPATPENRHRGCGVDISGLWAYGTVTSVGAESDRTFEGDAAIGSGSGAQPQELENPGFETGDYTGWTNTIDWDISNSTPYEGAFNAYTNVESLLVGEARYLEKIEYGDVIAGRTVILKAHAMPRAYATPGGEPRRTAAGLTAAWYTSGNVFVSEAPFTYLTTSTIEGRWREMINSVVVPTGAEKMRIRLYAKRNSTGGGTPSVRFDSVSWNLADRTNLAPVPGRVQFLTGRNVGREFAIESIDSGAQIDLIETTGYPIEVGDTYRVRPDCGKRYLEDCIGTWNNGPNFKGEPYIPDGSQVAAPRIPAGE